MCTGIVMPASILSEGCEANVRLPPTARLCRSKELEFEFKDESDTLVILSTGIQPLQIFEAELQLAFLAKLPAEADAGAGIMSELEAFGNPLSLAACPEASRPKRRFSAISRSTSMA